MTDGTDLRGRVISGVAWASATRLFGQLLNWAMTIFVMRLLAAEDYGLMALSMGVIGILQSLSYVGFADALVQARSFDDSGLRRAFGVILAINMVFVAILCLGAYPVAAFYDQPRLVPLLQAASLSFPMVALSSISRAKLDRALALKHTSRIEMASGLIGGVSVLAFALSGFGVWALLLGMLISVGTRSLGLWLLAPFREWPLFSLRGQGQLMRFGGLRTAENVIWTLSMQVDVLLVGKLLGQQALGVYTVSRTLAALPVDKVASVVKPIGFAAFSRLQEDREQAFRYLFKMMRFLAFACFPVFFGMAAVAPELVPVLLGARWADAVLPLSILAIGMALRPPGLLIPSFLMGLGEFGASFRNTAFGLVLFTVAYAVGSFWGLAGVCVGGAVAYPIQMMLLARRVRLVTGHSEFELLGCFVRPLICAALMFATVEAARMALGETLPPLTTLIALVALGVAAYAVATLVLCRPIIADALDLAPGLARIAGKFRRVRPGKTTKGRDAAAGSG